MESLVLYPEQIDAIKYRQAGPFAVKGIAGSGKTTVGIYRVPYLKEKCYNNESILVVTYHKVLTDYLKHLNSKLLLDGSYQFDFDATDNVQIINIDKLVYQKYSDYRTRYIQKRFYKDLPLNASSKEEISEVFLRVLTMTQETYPDLEILNPSQISFLKEEVDYINYCRIDSLKQYQIFTRKGRNRFKDKRYNLPKKSLIREAIYLLRRNYNNELIKIGKMDFPVMRLLALREVIDNPPKQYTHIIIDECQDMDKTRMDFLKHFLTDEKHASATFLYDNTQSIYSESWLGNGHGFNTLGVDIKGKSKILKKNFRTTYEIQEAAQSLLKNHQLFKQEVEPILINKSGIKPFWAHCNDYNQQLQYIVDIIKTHTRNLQLEDIIVATRTNNEAQSLYKVLNKEGIGSCLVRSGNNSFAHNQVRVMTLNSSKGLESKMVILANLNEDRIPIGNDNDMKLARELKLLYVGMTRASRFLYLTSFGNPSPFLTKISTGKLSKVDFSTYEWFREVQDPVTQKRILELINKLEAAIQEFVSIQKKANSFSFFQQTKELMLMSHRMEQIHDELHILEKDISMNSSLYDIFNSFHRKCEEKLELAQQEIITYIQSPVSFKEMEEKLSKRFDNFGPETINTIATAEYHIDKVEVDNQMSEMDWGPFMTCYSKSIEIELEKLFTKYQISLFHTKRKDRFGNPSPLNLKEELSVLRSKGGAFRDLFEMMEFVNFRKKRNAGTHKETISEKEIFFIHKMMMQEDGVYCSLNKLLAE